MKPRDAAAVLFGLKFADTFTTSIIKSSQASKARLRAPNIPVQKEFNVKWPFKIIQGDVF